MAKTKTRKQMELQARTERKARQEKATTFLAQVASAIGPLEPELSDDRRAGELRVSLTSEGSLQVLLPTAEGGCRLVPLKPGKEVETLTRILEARAGAKFASGTDGAPTRAQTRHWEMHSIFPSSSCSFCIAEGRARGSSRRPLQERRIGDGTCVVRTIPPKGGKIKQTHRAPLSLEDSGL